MLQKCAHCGSADTQAAVHRVQCLACGRETDFKGKPFFRARDRAADKAKK